jgi:hypothetical protein
LENRLLLSAQELLEMLLAFLDLLAGAGPPLLNRAGESGRGKGLRLSSAATLLRSLALRSAQNAPAPAKLRN